MIKRSRSDRRKIPGRVRQAADLFGVLSDPTRINLLKILNPGKELCVTEISQKANLSLSTTSHQLRKLEFLGITQKCRYGKEVCYLLNKKIGLTRKIRKMLALAGA